MLDSDNITQRLSIPQVSPFDLEIAFDEKRNFLPTGLYFDVKATNVQFVHERILGFSVERLVQPLVLYKHTFYRIKKCRGMLKISVYFVYGACFI